METSNRKDRLNRLRLKSDDRDDPWDKEDYMETRPKIQEFFQHFVCQGPPFPWNLIVCAFGDCTGRSIHEERIYRNWSRIHIERSYQKELNVGELQANLQR